MMGEIITIVGRPNVGKSTLFNRLIEKRAAIIDEISGVTRDRHYGKCLWNGRTFSVIDTGGYQEKSVDIMDDEIKKQIDFSVDQASIILFMVDAMEGLRADDKIIAQKLRKSRKPIFLVVNKVDNNKLRIEATEFYALGFEKIFMLSAMTGTGTGDFLDELVEIFPAEGNQQEEDNKIPKIAIVGRPNVGKSTLANSLLDEKRSIVTQIAGTTRDTIETVYNKFGKHVILLDTAGLRKKRKVEENIEFYSTLRAIKSIEYCDVSFLVINAEWGLEAQDLKILQLLLKNRKGVILLVNKWDLVKKHTMTSHKMEIAIRERLKPFSDMPILFISAIHKKRIFKAIDIALKVHQNRKKRIKTRILNEILLPIIEKTPPPSTKGKYIRIKYVTQLPSPTPQFAFFANLPQYIKDPYKRFIENQLRKHFDFEGVPISIYFRKK